MLKVLRCRHRQVATARLDGYEFDYTLSDEEWWHGATADIVKSSGHEVLGAVWELDEADGISLDQQEGVKTVDGKEVGDYKRLSVEVVGLDDGQRYICRSYGQLEGWS